MSRYVSYRDFDWVLLSFVLAICTLGVFQIHSATEHTKFAGAHLRQIYWIVGGVGAMFLVSLVNYQALLEQVHWMYVVALASLIAVLLFGQRYLGAKRWIKMPAGVHFQPSEWVKLILILAVAKYFADLQQRELSWPDFLKAGAIVSIPMLLVLKQPDLGTALTYLPVAIMGLFLGGMRWKQALVILTILALLLPVAWIKVLKPYQKERLSSFRDPDADRKGSGYQVNQSLNRGRFGRNLGKQPGVADTSGVSAGAANGLYFCRVCRGARVCRSSGGTAVILYSADAFDAECANGARSRWRISGHGCGGCA